MLLFSPGLNMLFESSELPYGATGLTTCHGFVGVEIMIGDIAAWDGSGSGEGKPKARVKCVNMGRSAYTPRCVRLRAQSDGLFRPELARERSVSIVVLSISC